MAKKTMDFAAVRELHKAGLLDDAETGYLTLLRARPNDADVLHSLGIVYTQKKKFEEAINYIKKAIQQQPRDPALSLNLANVLKLQGLLSEATQLLENTTKEHPGYPPAFNNLGSIYHAQGRLDAAIQAYQQAIEKYPGYIDAHYNLALAFSKNNQLQEARHTYQKLLSLSPDHLAARFQLACLLMQENNITDALKEFITIEIAQPYHFETQTNLATCYLKLGKLDEAKIHYLKATELNPDDTQTLFNLGVIHTQQDNLDNAIQFYQKALVINPNYFAAHNNLAAAFLAKRHFAYALKHFQEALRLQPQNQALRYTVQALTQNQTLFAAPPAYVQSLFDAYADHYEPHLLQALDYKLPDIFAKALTPFLRNNLDIVDIGCGTGLCGIPLKFYARNLLGIDLSSKMLAVAAQKNIYDELIHQDLVTYLKNKHNAFDLIIAGDVLVYTGELDTLLNLIHSALRYHGLFIFNTEINTNADYQINQSGRFSHHQSYLEALAEKNHFNVLSYQQCLTRMQNNDPVYGHLYILQKG